MECCGAGGIIKTHESKIMKWFINCGAGTNTKAKLMGLWATLTMATHWSIKKLQVLGDSKVIIDWINLKGHLHAVNFEGWKLKTKELATTFQDINFQHIYRITIKRPISFPRGHSRNRKADCLFFTGTMGLKVLILTLISLKLEMGREKVFCSEA
jgi:ribonuclease HI